MVTEKKRVEKRGILRIAITGHRYISCEKQVALAVERVLLEIEQKHPNDTISLVTALAEGSDQLAASAAGNIPDLTITIALPMLTGEYLSDFYSEKGKKTFTQLLQQADEVIQLPKTDDHTSAYRQLGSYLVQHSDCLVAIWNGDFNHEEGGTGEVVAEAICKGKTIYWIYCENEKPGAENPLRGIKKIGDVEILHDATGNAFLPDLSAS